MNKTKRLLIVLLMLLGVGTLFLASHQDISAKKAPPPAPGVADGGWQWNGTDVTGVTGPIDLVSAPQPQWYEVMDWQSITLSGAAELCHPFHGGTQGWVADIRIFTGKAWEPIPTTMGWLPDEEGTYLACAKAPSAGTYALFGRYVEPEAKPMPECDFEMVFLFLPTDFFRAPAFTDPILVSNLLAIVIDEERIPAEGTVAKYTLSNITPPGAITGDLSGTTTFQKLSDIPIWYPVAYFDGVINMNMDEVETYTVTFTTMGCYVRYDWEAVD